MKSHLKALFVFIFISGLVIFSWFRFGYLYGGGDVGLQTYNPQRILQNAGYTWWDSAGPGAALPQGLSAIPFQGGLYLLQLLGFGPVALEAILFFVLLLLMGFGMYLFASDLFPKERKYAFLAGLFYMFNPYMMIQVWHRFIHTTILLAAALPFLGLFWNRWIKGGGFKHFLFFLITSFLSVYAFGTYAFIVVVWIFLTLFTFGVLIPWKGKKHLYKIGLKFIFGFIIWILINAWWMIPVAKISPAVLSAQHKTEESLMTLITISSQEILPFSMQLINPFYLVNQADFGSFYNSYIVKVIPWIFISIILIGLISSMKQKSFSLFGIFYILALFLAKGGAPPFGNAYISGFSNIFALGVLRNPFEKSGLILVFFSTILFILGFKVILSKFTKYSTFIFTFICFLIILFAWPMFLGKVIGRVDKPAFVQVPAGYKEADGWFLNKRKEGVTDGKILHLPLSRKESIQYNWSLGYNGLEPSDTFFTAYPSVSRAFNIRTVDDALNGLGSSFLNNYMDSSRILAALSDFNIRFIVLHKDVNFAASDLENPGDLEKVLDKFEFLERRGQFEDLVIYQVKDKYFKSQISIEHNSSLIYPGEENLGFWPRVAGDGKKVFITDLNSKASDFDQDTFIFPKSSFIYGISSNSASPVDRLRSFEPVLEQTGMIQSFDLAKKIVDLTSSLNNMDQYSQKLKEIFPKNIEINKFEINGQESLLSSIFRDQLGALRTIEQSTPAGAEGDKIKRNRVDLEKYLNGSDLKPHFFDNETGERKVFRFTIPKEGSYTLLMTDAKTAGLYDGDLGNLGFYINSNQSVLPGKISDNVLNFGNFNFEQGDGEISYPLMLSKNLAGSVISQQGYLEIPLTTVSGSSLYRLSGEATTTGAGFYVLLFEDQNTSPSLKSFLQVASLGTGQKFQISFSTKQLTKTVRIILTSGDPSVPVTFSNIAARKVLNNMIFLYKNGTEQSLQNQQELVDFSKKSPVEYQGKIRITNPGFLFFRETYHPDWKLKIWNKEEDFNVTKHFLGSLYANAWYIDKAGEYNFRITFDAQNNFSTGILLTGLGFLLTGAYGVLENKLK